MFRKHLCACSGIVIFTLLIFQTECFGRMSIAFMPDETRNTADTVAVNGGGRFDLYEFEAPLRRQQKPVVKPKPKVTQSSKAKWLTYKIKRGDTLGGIAAKYHVSVSDLKKWNKLKSTFIREGNTLKIYRK